MGDANYGGEDYGDYFFEDDWLYIEDDIAFADELAETQIPSPGHLGTNAELMLEGYEYDTYEYFGELEYGSDEYWDITLAAAKKQVPKRHEMVNGSQSPRKRKRAATTTRTEKRRKIAEPYGETPTDGQSVVYRHIGHAKKSVPTIDEQTASFALFPDWRERFPDGDDVIWQSTMPEDMKRAAEPAEDEMESNDRVISVDKDGKSPNIDERSSRHKKKRQATRTNSHDIDESDEITQEDLLSSLDPEALRQILKSQLGNTGMDEDAFMGALSKMLSGGGSADDAAAQLATLLLDQQDTGVNEAALGWLQDRGVRLADVAAEEEGDEHRIDKGAGLPNDSTEVMLDENSLKPDKEIDQIPLASSQSASRSGRKKAGRGKR